MHNALGVILSTYTYCTAYMYSLKLLPQCPCISLVGYHIASARPAAHVPHNYIHLLRLYFHIRKELNTVFDLLL